DDRQRQRDGQPPAGPLPDRGVHLHAAPDAFDVGLHHVHPDPPPGHVGHRRRGGQPGPKHQPQHLPTVHPGQLVTTQHNTPHRAPPPPPPAPPARVDPGPVVGHLHHHMPTLVVGPQRQRPLRRLARRLPPPRRLHLSSDD